jgi:hypothetical protein
MDLTTLKLTVENGVVRRPESFYGWRTDADLLNGIAHEYARNREEIA